MALKITTPTEIANELKAIRKRLELIEDALLYSYAEATPAQETIAIFLKQSIVHIRNQLHNMEFYVGSLLEIK